MAKNSDENCQKLFHFLPEAVFEINQKCILSFYTSLELPLSTLQSGAKGTLIFRKNCLAKKLFNYLLFRVRHEKMLFFQEIAKFGAQKEGFFGQKLSHEKLF